MRFAPRRAIFVVAHRVNGVAQLVSLDDDAHAIEIDVVADADGRWRVDHDGAFPWSTQPVDAARALGARRRPLAALVINVKSAAHDVRTVLAVFDQYVDATTPFVVECETFDALDRVTSRHVVSDGAWVASARRVVFAVFTSSRANEATTRALADARVAWFGIGVFSAWPFGRAAYADAVAHAVVERDRRRTQRPRIAAWTLGTKQEIADALERTHADVLLVVPHLEAWTRAAVERRADARLATAADV